LERLYETEKFEQILYETELKKRYGWNASSVDMLIIYGDTLIFTQCKWRVSRRRESLDIAKFLNSAKHISQFFGTDFKVYGLWVSRREPFSDNKELLKKENMCSISNFDSMDKLADAVVSHLVGGSWKD
jgi:hypothetical protein